MMDEPTRLPIGLEWLAQIIPLLGSQIAVLGPSEGMPPGRDIDCACSDIDDRWPLRLPTDIRLVAQARYDGGLGRLWTLERAGQVVMIDALDDPRGVGTYAFSTTAALGSDALFAPSAVRAAYLSQKAVRKGDDRSAQIAMLTDGPLGPTPSRLAQRLRRLRSPGRLAIALGERPRLIVSRAVRPIGVRVCLVGPDGTGKSTLAAALPDACGTLFLRSSHHHWRPGVLPRPGLAFRTAPQDETTPHERTPHGPIVSYSLLLYYWLDFLLGGWITQRSTVMRSGLVVVERGWSDLEVDPARHRLRVSPRLVRLLGRCLPRPALTLLLDAPPAVLAARKGELSDQEVSRQSAAWKALLRPERDVVLDATRSPTEIVEDVREAIVAELERRAANRVAGGWVALPPRGPRVWLPRRPAGALRAAVSVLPASTSKAQRLRRALRLAAPALTFLPGGGAPPRGIRTLLAGVIPQHGTYGVSRSTLPGRYTALISRRDGSPHAFAKLALHDDGRGALEHEAEHVGLAARLHGGVRAPSVIGSAPGLLLLEPVTGPSRRQPWELPAAVATALGRLYADTGLVHGDLAPWNLLADEDGWVVVDWEHATVGGAPFTDVFTWFLQSSTYLGRPPIDGAALDGGPLRRSLDEYGAAAGLPFDAAASAGVAGSLARSVAWLEGFLASGLLPDAEHGTRAEIEARRALLTTLERS